MAIERLLGEIGGEQVSDSQVMEAQAALDATASGLGAAMTLLSQAEAAAEQARSRAQMRVSARPPAVRSDRARGVKREAVMDRRYLPSPGGSTKDRMRSEEGWRAEWT